MNIKYFISILLIFFYSCTKNKKDNITSSKKTDSTSYYLKKSEIKNIPETDKLKEINKAYNYLKTLDNNSDYRNKLAEITFLYFGFNQTNKFDEASRILYKNSLEGKDSINLGKAYRCRAIYYNNIQVLDSSFIFYSKAEKLYFKLNDKVNYGNVLLNKGIIQYSISDYLGAQLSLTKANTIFKELNDDDKLYGTLNQLGLVSNELKEYNNAAYYHTKALEILKKNNNANKGNLEAACLNNLGYLYLKSKNYSKGIYYFEAALKDKTILKNSPNLYANLLDNLAYCKLQINDLNNITQLFFDALKIRKERKNTTAVVGSYIHISEYFQNKNDITNAIKYSNNALKTAKSSKVPINIVLALKQASLVDLKKASLYSKEYIRISDSLQLAERYSRDRFTKIELETDEIIQENVGLAEKNRTLLYTFLAVFVVLVLLFIVRAQRARTRELLYKQAQQKANEDIYNLMMSQQAIIDESRSKEKKRLAQDLHDGVLGRMFGLRLNLDSLNSNTDEEAVKKRFELLNELKTIEQDIREISHDLNREKQVLINNFVSIVHNLLEEQKSSHEANVTYTIDNDVVWDKVANNIKINMYRILQEGLQNINKYAEAKNITVEVKGDKENVSLTIQDDGVGFDVTRKSKGIGMQNMISRTNDCHGIIDIWSKKNEGTKIIITLPKETKQLTVEQE